MSYKVLCPYCKNELELDTDDYGDQIFAEDIFTVECRHCGKIVMVEPHVTVRLEGMECKCQGKNHKWLQMVTFPKCFTEMVCEYCGERRPMTDEEKKEFDIPTIEDYMKSIRQNNETIKT